MVLYIYILQYEQWVEEHMKGAVVVDHLLYPNYVCLPKHV